MARKFTITHDDGTTEELDAERTIAITTPINTLRELAIMDQMSQMMRGLNTNERNRIIAWLSDRNVNTGVD